MGLTRCLKYIYDFHKINRLDYKSILNIQRHRFLHLVKHAKKHSSFYSSLYNNFEIDDNLLIEQLPVLDKKTIMDNFDNIVTVNDITLDKVDDFLNSEKDISRKLDNKYNLIHSSGTTGRRWISIFDDTCFDYEIASTIFRKMRKFSIKHPRIAIVATENPHVGSTIFYKSMPHFIANVKHFSVKEPISILVEKLNDFNPNLLGGYPGILKALCDEKMKGSLKISPKRIYSGAYLLTEDIKSSIITAFNLVPFIFYAATEATGPIAVECDHHSLHVFIDSIVFEVLDDYDKPMVEGKPGKVVMTNLMNLIQPIIRYRLCDIVQMSNQKCPCGSSFPVIKKIWGREGDIIWVEKDNKDYEIIDPILFNLKISGLEKLQVIQEKNDFLRINIIVGEKANKDEVIREVEKAVINILRQKDLHNIVRTQINVVHGIPLVSGLHKLVISKIGKLYI